MKKGILYMLLLVCSILITTVGYADTSVKEKQYSARVISFDVPVINIENQVVVYSTFDLHVYDYSDVDVGLHRYVNVGYMCSPMISKGVLNTGLIRKTFKKESKNERGTIMQISLL